MHHDIQDVMGEKPVKKDAGQLSLDEESKKEAWKSIMSVFLMLNSFGTRRPVRGKTS